VIHACPYEYIALNWFTDVLFVLVPHAASERQATAGMILEHTCGFSPEVYKAGKCWMLSSGHV
jgi:hypothetical protein